VIYSQLTLRICAVIVLCACSFPLLPLPPTSTFFPYTTLFRSLAEWSPLLPARNHRDPPEGYVHPFLRWPFDPVRRRAISGKDGRSEEHTSELQSRFELVCGLLLEKKNNLSKWDATGSTLV